MTFESLSFNDRNKVEEGRENLGGSRTPSQQEPTAQGPSSRLPSLRNLIFPLCRFPHLNHFPPTLPPSKSLSASRNYINTLNMSAPTHSGTLRSLYRRFLRELPSRSAIEPTAKPTPTLLSHPSPLQRRIRTSFSTSIGQPGAQEGSANIRDRIQRTEQFLQYVKAQRMYATLVERYNPGMTMSEEERVRLTARRVGMDLPPEWEAGSK